MITVIYISGILKLAGELCSGKVDRWICNYMFFKLVGEYGNNRLVYSLIICDSTTERFKRNVQSVRCFQYWNKCVFRRIYSADEETGCFNFLLVFTANSKSWGCSWVVFFICLFWSAEVLPFSQEHWFAWREHVKCDSFGSNPQLVRRVLKSSLTKLSP